MDVGFLSKFWKHKMEQHKQMLVCVCVCKEIERYKGRRTSKESENKKSIRRCVCVVCVTPRIV